MRKIPTKLREQMAADPFYSRCCITGRTAVQEKIDWHHAFIYAGSQCNEAWCILPLARSIHERVHEPEIKDLCDHIMLNRADDDTLRKYSKAVDLIRRREVLNKRYGTWSTLSAIQQHKANEHGNFISSKKMADLTGRSS